MSPVRPAVPARLPGPTASARAIIDVVPSDRAAGLCREAPRCASHHAASRSRKITGKGGADVAAIPLSFNCLCLRSALASGLAVRNTLSSASGKTTVPHVAPVRPPGRGRRKACWRAKGAPRAPPVTTCHEGGARADTASVRMASLASLSSKITASPSNTGAGEPGCVRRCLGFVPASGAERHQPVERPAVQVVEAQLLDNELGHRPLARRPRGRRWRSPARADVVCPPRRRSTPGRSWPTHCRVVDAHRHPAQRREREAHRHAVVVVGVDGDAGVQLRGRRDLGGSRRPPRPARRACAAPSPSRRCGRSPSPASCRCCGSCSGRSANSATTAAVIAASGM